jgi:hypothetical protein
MALRMRISSMAIVRIPLLTCGCGAGVYMTSLWITACRACCCQSASGLWGQASEHRELPRTTASTTHITPKRCRVELVLSYSLSLHPWLDNINLRMLDTRGPFGRTMTSFIALLVITPVIPLSAKR